jgi:hypothetical protein
VPFCIRCELIPTDRACLTKVVYTPTLQPNRDIGERKVGLQLELFAIEPTRGRQRLLVATLLIVALSWAAALATAPREDSTTLVPGEESVDLNEAQDFAANILATDSPEPEGSNRQGRLTRVTSSNHQVRDQDE